MLFKGSQSCLVSGCNVIFLVDTSNEMISKNFDKLKEWMKKLITSLSIQSKKKFVYTLYVKFTLNKVFEQTITDILNKKTNIF